MIFLPAKISAQSSLRTPVCLGVHRKRSTQWAGKTTLDAKLKWLKRTEGTHQLMVTCFIKTHINKVSGKVLDPFSQGYIAQLREQSWLDENGLDEDGNQQSISNEVYANVVPTNTHKRIRAQRCNLEYSRNGDFEREKEEREEEFKRQMKERDAEWERRMEAQNEKYNMRQNQMMEYVRLCMPDLFTRSEQLSGPSDHLFRTGEHHHRPWEQLSIHGPTPFIPLEQRQRPGEHPGRPEEKLFGPAEALYRPGEHINRHEVTPFIPLEKRQRPGSSLEDLRRYSLDLRSRFTYPGTNSTDLKMIVRGEQEQTSEIGYLGRLGVDLTWTRPSLIY